MGALKDAQWEFLRDVATLIHYIESKGWSATGGELLRTPEQQQIYFKSGRSKTMNSRHLVKLAIDLAIFDPQGNWIQDQKRLAPFGDFWEGLHPDNIWGGFFPHHYPGSTFVDIPHFERKPPV